MIAADLIEKLRAILAPLSPRRRRWDRFLRELPLDPDALPRPLSPPGPRDFIICGAPRTGTTLLAAMLFQPPRIVTVVEPWDGMRLPPAELFASLRQELEQRGQLVRGKLDVASLLEHGTVKWCAEGTPTPRLEIGRDTLLGVKWPAYWRYLDLLPETKFLVCVRNPVDVVNSFKAKGGRLAEGLEYDIAFNRGINQRLHAQTDDAALRRVLLYEEIVGRTLPYLPRSNVRLVRYERWFSEPNELVQEIGEFLGASLDAGAARVTPSERGLNLTDRDLELIWSRCASARKLGYGPDDEGPGSA